jgi:intracellular sulfur oxidation DsrE/DsrF family protein
MTSRKEFLAAGSLFALVPAAAGAATPKPKATPEPKLTFDFDRARFEQILAKPAKHKQCFGVTRIEGGSALESMNNSVDAYETFLKEGAGAMQAVAVLYHGSSIFMAMNDALWNELLAPFFRSHNFAKYAPPAIKQDVAHLTLGKGNPFLHSTTNDPDDISVESLAAKGSNFFVCHNAVAGFSGVLADDVKESAGDVHRRLMASIVPAALVVPAGVMAINACQEAKFTYIQSNLL